MIIGIVHHSSNREMLDNLLRSIEGVKYPVIIFYNHAGWDGYELGALTHLSKIDDVCLLQDSVEIKDIGLFDRLAAAPGGVALCHNFQCYLGKYSKKVLDSISIPEVRSKTESVNQESQFYYTYSAADPDYQTLEPVLHDNHGRKEYRFGRENLILENDYLIKYKGYYGQY